MFVLNQKTANVGGGYVENWRIQ